MKANKYRLETVLEVRSRARDEAARLVALCLEHLQAAEEELARRRERLEACVERQNKAQMRLNEELNQGIQARDILAHQNYLFDLKKQETELRAEVENQIETVAAAEKQLAAARGKMAESARELKSIEAHKTNWQTAREKEENRREQKFGDEIGAILHNRGKSG